MEIRSIKYTAAAFLALGSFTLPSCKQEKPNIIFILADDLGYHQVGAFGGSQFYETPKTSEFFRGSKADLYEGGIRSPMIVKWDKRIKPGSINEELVISNDFYPTLCEVAGIERLPKDIDGVSLVPLLKDPGTKLDREAIYWHFPHYHSLGIEPQGAIRKGKYKLIENFDKSYFDEAGGWELFDLESDPRESINLIDKLPEVAEELRNELRVWRKSVAAQMMTKNPNYEILVK